MILDGHEVEGCLAHLGEIEAAFPDMVGPHERESVFRVTGRWLVEEGHLRRRLLSRVSRALHGRERTPFVGDLKAAPLARAALAGPRVKARSNAVAICFKQNIRAFYLAPRPVTLKMANPTSRGRGIQEEIEIRRRLPDTAGVTLPRLIARETDGPLPYLWEELVLGRHLDSKRDRAFFLREVLPRILDFHAGGDVRLTPVSDFVDLERLVADVSKVAEQVHWSHRWIDRSLFQTRVSGCRDMGNRLLLVGTGHGDLSNGNILITDEGRVCLVDWSRSRRLILLQDLEKLFQEYPGSWALAVERLESLGARGADPQRLLPWSDQALLGNFQLIQSFGAMRERLARRRDELGERYTRQCDRILTKEFATATRLIESGQL